MRSIRFTGLALAIGLLASATEASARSSPPPLENEINPRDTMVMALHAAPDFPIADYVFVLRNVRKVDSVMPAGIGTMEEMVAFAAEADTASVIERSDQTEARTRSTTADSAYTTTLMSYFHSNRTSGSAVTNRSRRLSTTSILLKHARTNATSNGGRGFL